MQTPNNSLIEDKLDVTSNNLDVEELEEKKKHLDIATNKESELDVIRSNSLTERKMEDTWQYKFLTAGTENGCGDLSIMISTVSKLLHQAMLDARNEVLEEVERDIRECAEPYDGAKWLNDVKVENILQIIKSKKI